MSIRKKFLITIGCTIILLSLIFFAVIYPLIHVKFTRHEMVSASRKIKQVQAIFDYQLQSLEDLVRDLADWPDTHRFITDPGDDAVGAAILRNSFVHSAKIDLLMILDDGGELVQGLFYDRKNSMFKDVNRDLLRKIRSRQQLLSHSSSPGSGVTILPFGDRYLIIAASPIRDGSSDNSTFSGTAIMGRFFDKRQMAQLQDLSQYTVHFYPPGEGTDDVVQASLRLAASSESSFMKTISTDMIKGYSLLSDVSGSGALMMVLTIDRLLHKRYHDSLPFLITAIILCCVVFGTVFYLFIEFLIAGRFTTLIADIKKIEVGGRPGSRLTEGPAADEFSRLSKSINHMLAANEKLEEYKMKNNMLESVATFAAGATHELATPLSTIAVASGELLRDLVAEKSDEGDAAQDLFLIREQVKRCKYIVSQMATSTVNHMGEENVAFIIQGLIDETLAQFNQSTRELINVDIEVGNQQLCMPFHSLCRVLRGLLRNAFQASEAGHPVFLSCIDNFTHLIFMIRDQGKGMDEHTLVHAVDPFFSTKDPEDNLGLGLYLAHSLANRFNGELKINSTPGSGTTVALSFAKEVVCG